MHLSSPPRHCHSDVLLHATAFPHLTAVCSHHLAITVKVLAFVELLLPSARHSEEEHVPVISTSRHTEDQSGSRVVVSIFTMSLQGTCPRPFFQETQFPVEGGCMLLECSLWLRALRDGNIANVSSHPRPSLSAYTYTRGKRVVLPAMSLDRLDVLRWCVFGGQIHS